ncbi:hypothetical protein NQ315_005435 [Exocentrus adspersus]|uniref:Reverse transcriptase domain-containing protein n=1 Tax=Exocentrus adspersus TaxID=1586481 RepID=A0AAV8VD18_9CUCU|nr:hypothetical protein NQ315_005435 [Exocentrus adspersus]
MFEMFNTYPKENMTFSVRPVTAAAMASMKVFSCIHYYKGNATVIMNTGDYNSKISNLITEGQYTKLNKDPTKNTPHFIEKLTTININSTELLVSFDVVSLFTNVPVDKTLSIVRNKLENDNNLKDRTKLNVSAFMELLTLCIKTTYFQLENDFYQQDFGMAMGSSLSPIMSNIFMEHFEETYVKSYINKPKIWWRYVDDVFSIWPHGQDNLTDFLNFLNNIEPTIKFTLELEENNKLPFLDVMISKNTEINSNFQTNVYRKKTNTNRYLNFNSNHHLSIKKGVIKSLYDRAKLVSSNVNFFNQEKDHIKNILKENTYPINLVDRAFLQIENPSHNNQQRQNPVANMTIFPGISEKLKKLGNNFNIRTAFKTNNTLRSILTHTKPINKEQNEKNCIYQIPCQCGKHYIGETSRPLDVRIKEHKNYEELRLKPIIRDSTGTYPIYLAQTGYLRYPIQPGNIEYPAKYDQLRIILFDVGTIASKFVQNIVI